jgi:hypothetical protein
MQIRKLTIPAIVLLFALGCQSDAIILSDNDYIVFGDYYGMCIGSSCVDIYRLEKDRILADTKKQYPSRLTFYQGKYTELSNEKFLAVKDIVDYFPDELLSMKDTTIGQPDAGDWGGFYVEYNYNGKHRFWMLDKMKSNVPESLHAFIDKLNEKLNYLETNK